MMLMAKKAEAVVEKVYVIPLRKAWVPTRRVMRSKKAVGEIRLFIGRHTRSKDVRLSEQLNRYLWKHGAKKPPSKVKVKVSVDSEGVARARMPEEMTIEEEKKAALSKEKKPASGAEAAKAPEAAAEAKPQEPAKPEESKS